MGQRLTVGERSIEPATINWYRSPIDKETLQRLTRRSGLRGWLQAGSFPLL